MSFQGPKPRRRRKSTTVHDLKCLTFFFPDIFMVSDCLAAVKYETKTEIGQNTITSDVTHINKLG